MRPPAQHPGPWAGTIAFSCEVGVGVTCPLDKWVKARGLLAALQQELESQATLQRKPLESLRGFFIHLMRTFPIITPYLKGIHLTLDGWRAHRDEEMWRVLEGDSLVGDGGSHSEPAPLDLQPAPRLTSDV
jgi:hypothetical protein